MCLAVLLAAAAAHAQTPVCDRGDRDWEVETFGIALPSPPPVDLSRLPTRLIERHYVGPYRMAAMLARGDFNALQAHWDEIAALTDRTEQMRATVRSLDALEKRGMTLLHQAQAWHARNPQSAAAQLMLATAWKHAAYEVHRDRYVPERAGGYFHRPHFRARQALPLVDALLAQGGFYAMAAREVDLPVRFLLSDADRDAAWNRYLELIEFAPHYEWLYLRAAGHASTPHNPQLREQRFAQLRGLADRLQLPQPHRTTLDQTLEEFVRGTARDPSPQVWRPYWEARVKVAPTLANTAGWLDAEHRAGNWTSVIGLADRVLAMQPHHLRALERKASALRQLNRPRESYEAVFAAMMLGSDWASNEIVQAHVHGGLGVSVRDFDALYAHCALGATLGLASAANCLGSAHTEGFGGAPRNNSVALGWHLIGARGGHASSAHDLAVLLPRIVNQPEQKQAVELASAHWVRRAAAHDHAPSQTRLAARPDWGLLCLPDNRTWFRKLYQRWFSGE
ncbi:MAG: hypothetical protein ACK40L_10455 [Hydrogenophaga sp.]